MLGERDFVERLLFLFRPRLSQATPLFRLGELEFSLFPVSFGQSLSRCAKVRQRLPMPIIEFRALRCRVLQERPERKRSTLNGVVRVALLLLAAFRKRVQRILDATDHCVGVVHVASLGIHLPALQPDDRGERLAHARPLSLSAGSGSRQRIRLRVEYGFQLSIDLVEGAILVASLGEERP